MGSQVCAGLLVLNGAKEMKWIHQHDTIERLRIIIEIIDLDIILGDRAK